MKIKLCSIVTFIVLILSYSSHSFAFLLVSDYFGNKVKRYNTSGTFVDDFITAGVYGITTSFSDFGIGVNPEPTTILLLGSALLGWIPFRRKK